MRSELRFHPGKGSKCKIITSFKTKSKCWERGETEPGSQVLQQWRKEDNCLDGRSPPPPPQRRSSAEGGGGRRSPAKGESPAERGGGALLGGGAPPRRGGVRRSPAGWGGAPQASGSQCALSKSTDHPGPTGFARTPSLWAHEDGGSAALPGCPSEPDPLIPDPGEAPFFQNAVFSRPRAETKVKTNQTIVFWVPSWSGMANAALPAHSSHSTSFWRIHESHCQVGRDCPRPGGEDVLGCGVLSREGSGATVTPTNSLQPEIHGTPVFRFTFNWCLPWLGQ